MNKLLTVFSTMLLVISLSGCSNDDYMNAIPKKISALAEIDLPRFAEDVDDEAGGLLSQLLGWQDTDKSGLDLKRPVYFFETDDGTFGLCVKMDDDDDFEEYISALSSARKKVSKPVEWRKCRFSMYDDKWLIGWNDDAMLLVGPMVVGQQKNMQQFVSNCLKQKEEQSGRTSVLFEELTNLADDGFGRVSLKAFALPEQVSALFTVGLSKNGDPKQVLIAFDMQSEGDMLLLNSTISSRNENVDKGLKEARRQMRTIDMSQVDDYDDNAMAHLLFNINGETYLPFLRSNPAMQSLMTVANAAIDLDNIIKSIDGTCHIQVNTDTTGNHRLTMTALVRHTSWMKDVDYWKQSTPAGTSLRETTTQEEKNNGQHHFTLSTAQAGEDGDKTQTIQFGIYADKRFYIGTAHPYAAGVKRTAAASLPDDAQSVIREGRLAMLLNMNALKTSDNKDIAAMLGKVISPLSKKHKYTLYIYR